MAHLTSGMVIQPSRRTSAVVVATSLAAIAVLTLWPLAETRSLATFCIFCGPFGGVDFVLNTILFVPLGIGLRWLIGGWKQPMIVGVLTTLFIESMQFRFVPGRDASLGDLVANTLGAAIGIRLGLEVIRWLNAPADSARRLAGVSGILASGVVFLSALLLQPLSTRYPQWVDWAPVRSNMDLFRGHLDAVELNGRPIHPTEVLRGLHLLDSATGDVFVRARISGSVPATSRQAIIVRIANDDEEGFTLNQEGSAALFRSNIVANRLKLRSFKVALDGALPESGVGTSIEVRSAFDSIVMSSGATGTTKSVTFRRTVGLAWAMLLPWDLSLNPRSWPINALWLAALVFPVSFFTMRSRRSDARNPRGRITWWPLALTLLTVLASPLATGLSQAGFGEWLGMICGVAVSAAVERCSFRQSPDHLTQRAA